MSVRIEKLEDYSCTEELIEFYDRENLTEYENLLIRIRLSKNFRREFSLIYLEDQEIVGQILSSEVQIIYENKIKKSLFIQPLIVKKKYRRKGIGSDLITSAIDIAKFYKYESIMSLGCIDFYKLFGFKAAIDYNIRLEYKTYEDELRLLNLSSKKFSRMWGIVKFPREFL